MESLENDPNFGLKDKNAPNRMIIVNKKYTLQLLS
jgi:hypothetical protein